MNKSIKQLIWDGELKDESYVQYVHSAMDDKLIG